MRALGFCKNAASTQPDFGKTMPRRLRRKVQAQKAAGFWVLRLRIVEVPPPGGFLIDCFWPFRAGFEVKTGGRRAEEHKRLKWKTRSRPTRGGNVPLFPSAILILTHLGSSPVFHRGRNVSGGGDNRSRGFPSSTPAEGAGAEDPEGDFPLSPYFCK